MTKPRIRQKETGLYSCSGNGVKQYGVTEYKAFCQWRAVTNRQFFNKKKLPQWSHSITLDGAA